ncbi:hypothetical protein [Peribacillus asahii]|uniref:hypothetical protein n=1 Tax=Peribacillus asahii TaxID=228899 RepID=UPI002079F625|nr:hypothetical protein [Peribacillus asahii]USK62372.1 hypothetical protein LIT37_23030 [Peribacillus asahii]
MTAVLSSVIVSFLSSWYQYAFQTKQHQDALSSFYDDLVYGLIYLTIIYVIIGIPIATFIDRSKSSTYLSKLILFSLSGVLVGVLVSVLLVFEGFPFLITPYFSILGFVCSNVFLHIYIILTKNRN